METNHKWNGGVQHLVRRNECETALHTVKSYEEQVSLPATIGSAKNETEREHADSVSLPWMTRFATEAGVNPQTSSTIISQLNNYHRHHSIANRDSQKAKNEVTPPSGALKPPWEHQGHQSSSANTSMSKHPGHPPPLLLSESTTALATSVGRSTIGSKQVLSLPSKKGVPHIYHDYSNVPDVVGVVRKKTGGVTQPFPEKLHTMLDNDDDPSIAGWLPHGRAFLVRKSAEFTTEIMPK